MVDTETTGILDKDPDTKIVQITLMNPQGKIAFSSFINPERDIPDEVSSIHKIYLEDVTSAPTLKGLKSILFNFLEGKELVAYNAGFDIALLTHLLGKLPVSKLHCAMERYTAFQGYRKHVSLPNLSGGQAHDATTDCLNTLLLIRRMAGEEDNKNVIDLDF